jgi:DNA-binding Xre family transcriptional regulator
MTLKSKLDHHIIRLINKYEDLGKFNSRKELYETMNIKRQNIHRIKMGYAHFTFEHIYRLQKFLDIEPEELFAINSKEFTSTI